MPHSLTYAPPPRLHRARRWGRRALIVLFIGSVLTFLLVGGRRVALRYPEWRDLRRMASATHPAREVVWPPPGATAATRWPRATVFTHELKSTGGQSWVVSVELAAWADDRIPNIHDAAMFEVTVRAVPTWLDLLSPNAAPALPVARAFQQLPEWNIPEDFILYAGQTDPADGSHFTIQYQNSGQTGTIDGWLMPDNSVKLEPRDGMLAR